MTLSHRLSAARALTKPELLPHHKCRSLLVLDGETLSRDLLQEAKETCLQVANRVDILLLNPPKPPASMLSGLLIKLEDSGIDYRLTATTGKTTDLISQYLRRFVGISLIIVSALPSLGDSWRIKVADLHYQGYRLVTLQPSPMT